jgi:hypothetical protein
MVRLMMIGLFVSCLSLAGCREEREPDLRIDTPDGGVEVRVDD